MRFIAVFPALSAFLIAATVASAQTQPPANQDGGPVPTDGPFKTLKQQTSYLMGMQAGYSFQRDGLTDIDTDALVQGLLDAFSKADPQVDPQKFQQIITSYVQKLDSEHTAKCKAEAPGNRTAGQRYMNENKLREGVETTDSGLQYKVIRKGTGTTPKKTDMVTFHYRGRLIDDSVFDDSYKGGVPAQIPLSQLIPGWIEAMQMMKEGAKWELYVPTDLAYGDEPRRGSGVPAGATLIFEVELLKTDAGPPGGFGLQGLPGGGGN
ncbi:MAG: FKBP-type peptidyl-prolyl cis-trans isomerase [Pirellulales bacterium]|nr:FKBP-type peptidyl-prolyl cis-trans isomerase [Pirellulales bacterium]